LTADINPLLTAKPICFCLFLSYVLKNSVLLLISIEPMVCHLISCSTTTLSFYLSIPLPMLLQHDHRPLVALKAMARTVAVGASRKPWVLLSLLRAFQVLKHKADFQFLAQSPLVHNFGVILCLIPEQWLFTG